MQPQHSRAFAPASTPAGFAGLSFVAGLAFFGSMLGTAPAQTGTPAAGKQVEQSLTISEQQTVGYLLYLPKEFDAANDRQWPVLLFLHGRGESRGPLRNVASWGPPRMAARGDDLPYIVVSPQCPADTNWNADDQQQGILQLLDHIEATYPCDKRRVYLTGLSMGGYGSWRLAAEHGERFAATAPICGAGKPSDAAKLVDMPIWAWHGTEDRAVAHQHSVDMVEAIRKAGGKKVRFTSLLHIGHNSWSAAYATPELFAWFDSHHRP